MSPLARTPARGSGRARRWTWVLAALVVGIAAPAYPQGCAMCLSSAMSQGSRAMESMNLGILILLIPPFLMILGVLAFTFLRRS